MTLHHNTHNSANVRRKSAVSNLKFAVLVSKRMPTLWLPTLVSHCQYHSDGIASLKHIVGVMHSAIAPPRIVRLVSLSFPKRSLLERALANRDSCPHLLMRTIRRILVLDLYARQERILR